MNKKIIFFVLSVFFSFSAFSAGKVKAPGRGSVLIVGKLAYKTPIDTASREEGVRAFKPWRRKLFEINKKYDFAFMPEFNGRSSDIIKDTMDGYFFQNIKLTPNSNRVYFNRFIVSLFTKANKWNQFALPTDVSIVVPDDAVYVYIGTFEYDLDYALRIKDFNHIDEFEEAQKELNSALGKNVKLYRASLEF